MDIRTPLCNRQGASLIEAIIAMFILTIGILSVMLMQTRAMTSSSTAMNRTEANTVAQAFLETFKEVDFTNAILNATSITRNDLAGLGSAPDVQTLIKDNSKIRHYTNTNKGELPALEKTVSYAGADGAVVDQAGVTYQLGWAVEDTETSGPDPVAKTIWLFMTWNTPTGMNSLTMATAKYKNEGL